MSFLLNEADDKLLYSRGNYWKKALLLLRNYRQRQHDLNMAGEYDIIFIAREAMMLSSTKFEKAFAQSGAKVIYDFDDAIWLNDTSHANRFFAWMKKPEKIEKSIAFAHLVFAGNQYLAEYALQFNPKVKIVPTTIDTIEYSRMSVQRDPNKIIIGWSGSITTIKHFEFAIPFLKKIKQKFGDKVGIKVIGDSSYRNEELGITGIGWNKQDEVKELSGIDIGIMPLPDDPWARGKCGLKGLQYMALGIPTVMSPVGVNQEIIQHGQNGYLASGTEEWVNIISQLIESKELRDRVGAVARRNVEEKYSVVANRNLYLQSFDQLLDQKSS